MALAVATIALPAAAPTADAGAKARSRTQPASTQGPPTQWASAASATVHPGVQTSSPVGQCTANFVFYDSTDVYLGSAAHCVGLGSSTDTNGCDTASLPIGTPVTVRGARHPAKLFYSSWITMADRNESNTLACEYNDFALLVLDRRDHVRVNPSVPFWGGPEGIGGAMGYGTPAYAHGNSGLRLGLGALQPKTGTSLGEVGNGWSHRVMLATPGIPGDSGGAVLDDEGRATGVFSTIVILPIAGSNHATDVATALAYMKAHTGVNVTLAKGTNRFSPL